MHQTIKKVGADIETLKMNTAIAQLMTLVNACTTTAARPRPSWRPLFSC